MQCLYAPVYFKGLVEASSINKNTFHCPESALDCQDQGAAASGFDISDGRTLQLCNNQEYWLQQEAIQGQYISTVRNYTGTALQAQLADEGWAVVGGFAIIVSSNPLLVQSVMPSVQPSAEQTKVVAQLWYNGSGLIQLWSQDAQLYADGQSFQVLVSNESDDRLPTQLAQISQTKNWQDQFLLTVGIQSPNRQAKDYDKAHGSPKQIRLTQAGSALQQTSKNEPVVQKPKIVTSTTPVVQPKTASIKPITVATQAKSLPVAASGSGAQTTQAASTATPLSGSAKMLQKIKMLKEKKAAKKKAKAASISPTAGAYARAQAAAAKQSNNIVEK